MGKPNNSIGHVKLPGESIQRPIVPQQLWDGTTNYAASLPTLTEDSKILLSAVSVTYAQLRTLMNNNQLLAGAFYRITDFVTTTAQPRTRSAGHQFDLIVHAISSNELSEDANAVLHVGDTYFANSNLGAWVIKYCFANDTNRFAWADSTNGKGVIYYMKDEFLNECGYDFKNIQFARYKVTACANCPGLVDKYVGVLDLSGNAILTSYMTLDTTSSRYYYTFDCCQQDYSMNIPNTVYTRPDSSTFSTGQIQCTRCYIAPNENDTTKFWLNNVVNLIESSRDCIFRINGFGHDSTMLGGCSAFEVFNLGNSIVGCWGTAAYIDGYVAQSASAVMIYSALVCCAGTSVALASSIIGTIRTSCLISGSNSVVGSSILNYIQSSNIKCSIAVFMGSNLTTVVSCTGEGCTYYCYCCSIDMLRNISMYNTSLGNNPFMYYANANFLYNVNLTQFISSQVTSLIDSNLRVVSGCKFMNNKNLTCAQDLVGCNFGQGVNYLNISSTNTAQTITNTNFHDIKGTDASNIKTVVIPEDYSEKHTVEIYSSNQLRVYEID